METPPPGRLPECWGHHPLLAAGDLPPGVHAHSPTFLESHRYNNSPNYFEFLDTLSGHVYNAVRCKNCMGLPKSRRNEDIFYSITIKKSIIVIKCQVEIAIPIKIKTMAAIKYESLQPALSQLTLLHQLMQFKEY